MWYKGQEKRNVVDLEVSIGGSIWSRDRVAHGDGHTARASIGRPLCVL